MGKFQFTHKAVEDLSKIWEYSYEVWSENQADAYYAFLLDTCKGIAENPQLGKQYEGIHPSLFGYHANRHIIFYTILSKSEILVVRILHERMDLADRITE